jgi:hypothetical protein
MMQLPRLAYIPVLTFDRLHGVVHNVTAVGGLVAKGWRRDHLIICIFPFIADRFANGRDGFRDVCDRVQGFLRAR